MVIPRIARWCFMVLKGIGFLVYNGFWGDLVYRGSLRYVVGMMLVFLNLGYYFGRIVLPKSKPDEKVIYPSLPLCF